MSSAVPSTTNEQLSARDWRAIVLWIILAAASIVVIARYFSSAFPEASIDFKYDRRASQKIAERVAKSQGIDLTGMKHAASFESDGQARVFLERSIGLEHANQVMRNDVRVWGWHHRWFRPLVEEEISVDVAPTGEIIAFTHHLPEDRAVAGYTPPAVFLRAIGVRLDDLTLVEQSQRRLPKRVQRIFTWESKSVRPAGAPYRYTVTVDGNIVTSYSQTLKVPDAWKRSYREMRSKNAAASSVDIILMIVTMLAAVVVFIVRLRRGDLAIRFLFGVGAIAVILVGGVSLNNLPGQLAYYDTTTSYPAFIGNIIFMSAIECVGTAMLLMVICGAGEVLYRERLPQHLAIPRLWSRRAFASRRVFLSLILGYSLVPMFIGYQVIFYLVAQRFGAWAPQEVPYDEMLNTAFPWITVLFAGFFPAVSEEFLSRAFSVPLLHRFLRSRWAAIVLAGFIWGFGHAGYPNQPFWIRGVEVGLVGIVAGLLMDRFGLLPLLIWHYTIDAVYTSTLLFASGNTYYIVSASLASLLFAIPLVLSIVSYVRNRGFLSDQELTNETIPIQPLPEVIESDAAVADLPAAIRVTHGQALALVALIVAAGVAIAFRPLAPADAIDYRITIERAKQIAKTRVPDAYEYVIATPVEGFRSWDSSSPREEGGSAGGFDDVAANDLLRHGMTGAQFVDVFQKKIEAGTYSVRFFTPMQKKETFVEVDPRSARVLGYHRYQDEQQPGATLDRSQALARAQGAFAQYGQDARDFEVKETLTFQQPARRDWLFHFQEKKPLFGHAYRRVTVRVAGSEITQFNKTVKIPESVYREAETQTFFNVVLSVLRIAALVIGLAIIITGLVIATRSHGLPWRRALRWTAVLSILPIVGFFMHRESMLFNYNTSIGWQTYMIGMATTFVRETGPTAALIFISIAGLDAAFPFATRVLRREGRARFGRSAAVAALTVLATLMLLGVLRTYFPTSVQLSVPEEVAMPLPALYDIGRALLVALIAPAAVALFAVTLRERAALAGAAIVFLLALDSSVTLADAPLMIVRALAAAAIAWILTKFVLGSNPLAWPLTMFVLSMLQSAAALLHNQRADLLINGFMLLAATILVLAWVARPGIASQPDTEIGGL
jgi:membrane protease YdiL (CAAX protease family)